ncbi:AAA family ATPase [Natronomonas halophila]|uniref:AAA family ATPase n=1 Tax=Natronomonas halophila TaxID=2747817 RepID=UPI0015B4D6F8|nr:AAA family ATPase [Natronomonas halophila]QLD84916.1 AAA family ATPase [Natronomonas halophila]
MSRTGQSTGDSGERRPELVVVCGLPGVGKSTVARAVADRLDAAVLRTDVVRKELFDDPKYTSEESTTVYNELLARARDRLADGESVVLDATFKTRSRRREARDIAAEVDADFRLVHVDCDTEVVERRIAARDDVSDADFEVHLQFKDRFEPIEMDHERIDNSGAESETVQQVEATF